MNRTLKAAIARNARAAATPEAHKLYLARAAAVEKQIEALRVKLLKHAAAEAADQTNWGFAGDLEHVSHCLAEAIGE